jgi:hypothetical protein
MKNQHSARYRATKQPLAAMPAIDKSGCKLLTRAAAIDLVRDLFKHTGLDRLRAHRMFAHATFDGACGLDNYDLADAIIVGLDQLTSNTGPERSALNVMLANRVASVLGPLNQRVAFSVQGWPKNWAPKVAVLTH